MWQNSNTPPDREIQAEIDKLKLVLGWSNRTANVVNNRVGRSLLVDLYNEGNPQWDLDSLASLDSTYINDHIANKPTGMDWRDVFHRYMDGDNGKLAEWKEIQISAREPKEVRDLRRERLREFLRNQSIYLESRPKAVNTSESARLERELAATLGQAEKARAARLAKEKEARELREAQEKREERLRAQAVAIAAEMKAGSWAAVQARMMGLEARDEALFMSLVASELEAQAESARASASKSRPNSRGSSQTRVQQIRGAETRDDRLSRSPPGSRSGSRERRSRPGERQGTGLDSDRGDSPTRGMEDIKIRDDYDDNPTPRPSRQNSPAPSRPDTPPLKGHGRKPK